MYGVQVISESVDAFECIMYTGVDAGSRIHVSKLSREHGVYEVMARGDEVSFRSCASYADALFKMFPMGCMNMTNAGLIIPCTPARFTGKDIFRVWQSNGMVFLEVLTLGSRRRFVELSADKAFLNLQNAVVWFGFYTDAGRLMLCIVVSKQWNANVSATMTYEITGGGVCRRPPFRKEWFAGYKTIEEVIMGV